MACLSSPPGLLLRFAKARKNRVLIFSGGGKGHKRCDGGDYDVILVTDRGIEGGICTRCGGEGLGEYGY